MTNCISQLPSFCGLDAPKKKIRLLVVEPVLHADPVHCTIKYTSLKDEGALDYKAVSYVRGVKTKKCIIWVEDMPVSVPVAAAEALKNPRSPEETCILWIDVICIDQTNVRERNNQVALTGEIYRRTVQTVVWLGLEDEFTTLAYAALEQIYADVPLEYQQRRFESRKGPGSIIYFGQSIELIKLLRVAVAASAVRHGERERIVTCFIHVRHW
ncbi:hypothetical protein K458DRAFT_484971 [Lentithecium fluviatile CBS 122367]|uniref:Heterokaryon incompatibility domain-containing protein n=1 Tax=Lentithecium fluviatile CBS 122367 TaxID=1168545 RepID=A0A6G1JC82_9PLEO|nr:hypothetical protein K458DRAFT_484971 [Lentithecium fluviatile CBS 122367]